jgi:hypothetical protein
VQVLRQCLAIARTTARRLDHSPCSTAWRWHTTGRKPRRRRADLATSAWTSRAASATQAGPHRLRRDCKGRSITARTRWNSRSTWGRSTRGAAYRDMRLLRLIHSRRRTWWTAETGHPIESAAEDMLGDFHDHGWPAILAADHGPDTRPAEAPGRYCSDPRIRNALLTGFNPSPAHSSAPGQGHYPPSSRGRWAATGAAAGLRLWGGRM